ncbi:MAG TPA: PH domain-containing protein [Thermoplasmata archaeon]|nr:PH domain-containing protein [Thermoplasmata archaeon]
MAAPSPPTSMPRLLKATYLANQEALLEETRATKLYYFPGPVLFVLIFGFLTLGTWGKSYGFNLYSWLASYGIHVPSNVQPWIGDIFGVLFLLGLLWLLIRYFRWISTVYAVTSRRVIVQRGIFGRDFDEIPVTQIRGVDVHASFGQRILGYGTVRVSSEGGTKIGNEDWEGIPKPFRFQKVIENASQAVQTPH